MNGALEACVVTGANLGQPLGIVMLNAEAVERAKSSSERAALESSLSAHLDAVNARLDPHEQLDCLVVVTTPWSVENGFITPTFKVKRNRVEEVYGRCTSAGPEPASASSGPNVGHRTGVAGAGRGSVFR
jgi:long-chain acyl-CoA synthetase